MCNFGVKTGAPLRLGTRCRGVAYTKNVGGPVENGRLVGKADAYVSPIRKGADMKRNLCVAFVILLTTIPLIASAADPPKSSLEKVVFDQLKEANLTVGDAKELLQTRLKNAEVEVARSEKWRPLAEKNVADLMKTVIAVARERKTRVVTEDILREAEKRRCGSWPWCWWGS